MPDLVNKYNLKEIAAREGGTNHPPPNATTLSSVEQQIVSDFTTLVNDKRAEFQKRAAAFQAKRTSIESTLQFDNNKATLAAIPTLVDRELAGQLRLARSDLIQRRKRERERLAYLNSFKKTHGRLDEAVYPSSVIFHWAIVIALVAVESVLNSYFFAKGSEIGLLGGLVQALLVSVANVGSSIMVGAFVIRHLHHINDTRRLVAGAGLILWVFFIVAFNLGVAHYRTALGDNPETALREAVTRFLDNPLGVEDFDSWLLFVIGLVAAVLSLIKAYTADDRYPGYGEITRRYRDAEGAYHSALTSAEAAALATVDSGMGKARRIVEEIRIRIDEYDHSVAAAKALPGDLRSLALEHQQTVNGLLTHFRQHNQQVRAVPAPAYFSVPFAFSESNMALPIDVSSQELSRLEEYRRVLQTFVSEEAQVQEQLNRLSKVLSEKSFPDYVKDIETQAIEQITANSGFQLGGQGAP